MYYSSTEVGDKHAQEHPAMLSLSILLFRWHNYVVDHMVPHSADRYFDDVFAEARKWVIGSLQVGCVHGQHKRQMCYFSATWTPYDSSRVGIGQHGHHRFQVGLVSDNMDTIGFM